MAFSKYPNKNVTKGKCQEGTSGTKLREKHASQEEEEEGWGLGEAQGHAGEFVGPMKGFGAPVLKRGGGLWPPWTLNAEVLPEVCPPAGFPDVLFIVSYSHLSGKRAQTPGGVGLGSGTRTAVLRRAMGRRRCSRPDVEASPPPPAAPCQRSRVHLGGGRRAILSAPKLYNFHFREVLGT